MKSAHLAAIQEYQAALEKYGPVRLHSIPPLIGYTGFLQGQVEDRHRPKKIQQLNELVDRPSRDPEEYAIRENLVKPKAAY